LAIRPIQVLTFFAHQVVGTWGIGAIAYFVGALTLGSFEWVGLHVSLRSLQWLLVQTPFYPLQIAMGAYCGWLIARKFRHRSMLWVWVVPGLLLCYSIMAVPTLTGTISVIQTKPFTHYLGWGCKPKDGCIDQLVVTMPFYASLAYSIGAWLAFKKGYPHPRGWARP